MATEISTLEEFSKSDITLPSEFIMSRLTAQTKKEQQDEPLAFCNVAKIVDRFSLWKQHMPKVKPCYAVKCNDNPVLLECLVKLSVGFDCASKSEIKTILDKGVEPTDIIFANPCKPQSHVRYAAKKNVSLMTFDNEMELHKVASLYPSAKLVIRIRADADDALVKLGIKFGCSVSESLHLLKTARGLGLNVVGVSFHVGSGCQSAVAYSTAIQMAHQVFQHGKNEGFEFSLLDIGGGFPGCDSENGIFANVAKTVNECIEDLFFDHPNLTVLAEPGRFFATSCITLATQVISKRVSPLEDTMYYINDGVYGTFSGIMYENAQVQPHPLKINSGNMYSCSIWGPTCDSIDKIGTFVLPELDIGDWLIFYNMGAYSMASSSGFNGFGHPEVIYYSEKPNCASVKSSIVVAGVDCSSEISYADTVAAGIGTITCCS